MIFSPSRFVFIHIPRTAGLSITQALAHHLHVALPGGIRLT